MRRLTILTAMFVGVGILASAAGATTYIQFNAPGIGSGGFVVELNDNTPLHRDNFLRYVNGGLYVNQIIHRSDDANQVIQGGGFALSDDPDYLLQYVPVLDPPVTYEGNLGWSNTLYTLGAARTADPNSATNQWYINMGDNSADFDYKPGPPVKPGYTVFGRVVGGWTTVDAIYGMPVWNAASYFGSDAFSTLPLLPTFDINGPLEQEHFVTLPTTQVITGGSWLGAAGTPWQTPGNWSCYMAPIAGFTTTFDAATVSQPALTQAESVKQVKFVTAGWTISGGANVLTVGDGGIVSTPATDSNAISAAVTAGASANWTINNTVTLSGTLNLAGRTITKDGGGTLVVSGTQNHAAASVLNANAGNVVFNTDAGGTAHNKNLTVNVNGNAAVAFNSTEYLAGLNVNTGSATLAAGGTNILVTKALTVDTTDSALDITNNRLIVDYAPADANPAQQIQDLVRSGYNRGAGYWDGNGIFSSTARDDAMTLMAVGIIDNADPLVGGKATFGGVAVDASSVLVRYTYWGDMNFDGTVNFDDYDIIDYYYWFPLPADQMGWWTGDLDYDGNVDFDDYDLIDYAYWFQGAPLSGDGLNAVPEPATLTLLAMGGLALLRRTRRRAA